MLRIEALGFPAFWLLLYILNPNPKPGQAAADLQADEVPRIWFNVLGCTVMFVLTWFWWFKCLGGVFCVLFRLVCVFEF